MKLNKSVLITGGAGFIGKHLTMHLLSLGCNIRILDNFSPQVHSNDTLPDIIKDNVELIKGDILDYNLLKKSIKGMDSVIHLASETGTGQSMYEINKYYNVNVQGTANLLDILINEKNAENITNIVVSSSRSIYGEGQYCCINHGVVSPDERTDENMKKGNFEPICPVCECNLEIRKTKETALIKPASVYALTKHAQESLILLLAKKRNINAFAFRYQNVYGSGQSLKNPYTGILAVFSNLARNSEDIEIYEDGLESRDFVFIDDVVEATAKSLFYDGKFNGAINVGSGNATSVLEVAKLIVKYFKSSSNIIVTGKYRMGDIRHNIADISKLANIIDFKPQKKFNDGINEFLKWAESQALEDKTSYKRSVIELSSRGFMGQVN
jgi:dTDP-L-rhamnose 4-epimerase